MHCQQMPVITGTNMCCCLSQLGTRKCWARSNNRPTKKAKASRRVIQHSICSKRFRNVITKRFAVHDTQAAATVQLLAAVVLAGTSAPGQAPTSCCSQPLLLAAATTCHLQTGITQCAACQQLLCRLLRAQLLPAAVATARDCA
jgi:hypothetical protein